MNWNKFSLFKLPNKHKRFEYTPRYYDERKEALEKKIKQYNTEAVAEDEVKMRREVNFRENVSDRWSNSEFRRKNKRANLRLLIILVAVLGVFYVLFTQIDFESLSQVGK
ncbi:MAG: hypothetical protein MK078_12210 [Crocinitomicaceae bacterium]|nr:hypothetical protein [Crocinitomicaceae bacterium]